MVRLRRLSKEHDHNPTFAACPQCRDVFVDDIAGDHVVPCPDCRTTPLKRGYYVGAGELPFEPEIQIERK